MTKKDASAWSVTGALVAGLAAHWFIGGDATEHSLVRNLLVGAQFLVGLWMIIYAMRKRQST